MHGGKIKKSSVIGGFSSAFTLMEILVVISILGILASIAAVSFSSWQKMTYQNAMKSDANGVATAMENSRNFSTTGYPTSAASVFKPTKNVSISGGSTDGGKSYCVDITYSKDSTLKYYIDSDISSSGAQVGTCATRSGQLAAPANLVANTETTSSLSITFNKVSGATEYIIQQSTNASFTDAKVIANLVSAAPLPYTINSLTENTTYYYRVQSKNVSKISSWSSIADAQTSSSLVAVPAMSTITRTVSGDNTTFAWNSVSCAAGYSTNYQYRYSIMPSEYDSGWKNVSASTKSQKITTSLEGQAYSFSVRANCSSVDKTGDWNNGAKNTYTKPKTPIAPTISVGFTAPNITAQITNTPSCTIGSIQYSFRRRTNDGAWGSYSAWSAASVATIAATDDVKYGYQAQARCYLSADEYSKTTTSSEATYIKLITTPAAPVVAANTVGTVTYYSWPAVACTAGTINYQYVYTISPAGYNSGWVNNGSGNSLGFTTMTPGQTYTVQAMARCIGIYSTTAWTASTSASYYRPYSPPSAPTNLAAAVGANSISLSWTASADLGLPYMDTYNIYRGTSSGGETLLATIGNTTTSYNDTSSAVSTTYYYRITAKSSYAESGFSNEVTGRIEPVLPGVPQNFVINTCYRTTINGYSGYVKCKFTMSSPLNAASVTGGVTQYNYYMWYSYYEKRKKHEGWDLVNTTNALSDTFTFGRCTSTGCYTGKTFSVSASSPYGEGPKSDSKFVSF